MDGPGTFRIPGSAPALDAAVVTLHQDDFDVDQIRARA
jgi:hypothetical protein